MLIDQAKIYIEGGQGGKGCNSLFKDIYNRLGVPDGGRGGDGGDIVFISDPNLQTLLDFRYNQHYKAEDGSHGGSNRKTGRRGKDLKIKVPIGTIVKDESTGFVIRDLDQSGLTVVAAKGGAGGVGNSRHREASEGERGGSLTILLELKLVAEAGIIGFPNAGKSTIISRISGAHSKIAPYPFTTKSPQLGMVSIDEESFAVADMPGLIEGAHEGRGLGDRFLRHIERTRVLVHVVDAVPPDGSDPAENFRKLEKELSLYSDSVALKPRIVVLNKMDLAGADAALKKFKKKVKEKVFAVSAAEGEGLKEMVKEIHKRIKDAKKDQKAYDKDRDESLDWLRE
ncbi:MAG: GTPase ObgE [Candidatus Omnitrophica bacterium]|nr:GTPase ObgE [Candidatus Omnitrophota bacterium]